MNILRREEEKDYKTVENITREAFWNVYRPGCFEHYVLHKMRGDNAFIPELDYVAEENGRVVANIVYVKAYVTDECGTAREIAVFGPLSVLPEKQKQGYGRRLIEYTTEKAKEMGFALVAITGNPDYYRRFGFESASKYGIYYEGMPETEEAPFFMVKILDGDKAKNIRGTYKDPTVYEANEGEVDEFDKKFPPKIKEKREGQLV